jgi:hypothetical protein
MTDSNKIKADDPEQSKRFIETARKIETNDSPETFDKVFKHIVKKVPLKQDAPLK